MEKAKAKLSKKREYTLQRVFDEERTYFINNGNSGMATAGSGDVLTGIIIGLLGYHFEDVTMTVAVASYINGLAGDLAAKQYGEISMLSTVHS